MFVLCLLGGCSTKEEPKVVTYDWKPPFENVNWGMGEAEVLKALNLDEDEAILNVNPEKQRVFSFTNAMETKVGMASPDVIFEPGFGLIKVTLHYIPMKDQAAETLMKLEAAYGENNDGMWTGTKFGDLGLSEKQSTAFKKENKEISEYDPIVTISLNRDSQSVNYQECMFEARAAAILEQVLDRERKDN